MDNLSKKTRIEPELSVILKEIEERNSSIPLVQPTEDLKTKEARAHYEVQVNLPKKYLDIQTDRKELLNTSFGKSLFIHGPAGTGKTVFSCSIAKVYIRLNQKIKFLSYPSFIMQLQCLYRKDNEDPFDFVLKIATFPGYLILDDFGAEKLTEFVRQTTYLLLNEREQRCLPIIITSNYSLSELDVQVDPRISSRIAGMCEVLKFSGEDRRISKNG